MKSARFRIILVLFVVIGLQAAPQASASSLDSIYAEGTQSLEVGNLIGAIKFLEQVYQVQPHYDSVGVLLTSAYKFRGIELYRNDQPEEALKAWRRALEILPDDEEVRGFADRTEGELKALRRLAGIDVDRTAPPVEIVEPVAAVTEASEPAARDVKAETEPADETSGEPANISVSKPATPVISKPEPVPDRHPATAKDDEPLLRPFLLSEVAMGYVLPVGAGATVYDDGWLMTIGLSRISRGHRTGLRLLGTYARLPVKPGYISVANTHSRLSLTGAGLEGLFLFPLPGSAVIETSLGVGIYEAAMTTESGPGSIDITTRKTSPGYSAGARFSERIGSWYLAVESRYFRMPNSFAPSQLQFRFTFGAN